MNRGLRFVENDRKSFRTKQSGGESVPISGACKPGPFSRKSQNVSGAFRVTKFTFSCTFKTKWSRGHPKRIEFYEGIFKQSTVNICEVNPLYVSEKLEKDVKKIITVCLISWTCTNRSFSG